MIRSRRARGPIGLGERVDVAVTYSADVGGENVGRVGSAALCVRW